MLYFTERIRIWAIMYQNAIQNKAMYVYVLRTGLKDGIFEYQKSNLGKFGKPWKGKFWDILCIAIGKLVFFGHLVYFCGHLVSFSFFGML
jgi:hypothetical protein